MPRPSGSADRSLLTLVLDVSPSSWGERDLKRTANDKSRAAAGKRSVGPARLDDVLDATLGFCLTFAALARENSVVVVGAADGEVAVLYPRKGGRGDLAGVVHDPPDAAGGKVDAGLMNEAVRLGVAELVARAAARADAAVVTAEAEEGAQTSNANGKKPIAPPSPGAAVASALTVALCIVNRFMVAAGRGVSALADQPGGGDAQARAEEGGVLAMLNSTERGSGGGRKGGSRDRRRAAGGGGDVPSPRILVVQASEDRPGDYNAFMNGTFAAAKAGVVIDGCFIPSGIPQQSAKSPYLEQACDRTGGIFLAPSGAAQVGGALTEVLISVFLSPVSVRAVLNLPTLTDVDFRPRCFETGELVDVAHVCNQCLSIFKKLPNETCATCGARIVSSRDAKGSPGAKRAKTR